MIQKYLGIEPVIDSSAYVHERSTVIGEVTLGKGVSVFPSAVLRGDQGPVVVGADSNIQDGAICHATDGISTMTIGERVTVGHGAIVHGAHVGDDCIIGMGAILLDNARISPWTIVGAGALVPPGKEYPGGVLLVGSPAKVAREITDTERQWIDGSWREYAKLSSNYQGDVE